MNVIPKRSPFRYYYWLLPKWTGWRMEIIYETPYNPSIRSSYNTVLCAVEDQHSVRKIQNKLTFFYI